MTPQTKIISTGAYVPGRIVTNDDIEQMTGVTDAWIRKRTGIEERRWVDKPGMGASELGEHAAREALDRAGIGPHDVDALICVTVTPDRIMPGSGCILQGLLGMSGPPALDIRNHCAGFIYALHIADAWIKSGIYKHVLVVACEVHSAFLDKTHSGRDFTCLFGDGAGAVILGPTEDSNQGILYVKIGADGSKADAFRCDIGSARPSFIEEACIAGGDPYPRMDGSTVFKHAVRKMPELVDEMLKVCGFSIADLRLLIPHQANLRINEFVQRKLALRDDQVINNVQRYANTSGATIPIALHEALSTNRLAPLDLLGMVSFGAGFAWGAALIRW